MPYIPKVEKTDYANSRYEILLRIVDPIFVRVHDELSAAYYDGTPFRTFGILTKEQFDELHGLLWELRQLKWHTENMKLPVEQQQPESEYRYWYDDEGNAIDRIPIITAKVRAWRQAGYRLADLE